MSDSKQRNPNFMNAKNTYWKKSDKYVGDGFWQFTFEAEEAQRMIAAIQATLDSGEDRVCVKAFVEEKEYKGKMFDSTFFYVGPNAKKQIGGGDSKPAARPARGGKGGARSSARPAMPSVEE